MEQRARPEVRDEPDEVAHIRIREVQRERVALAAFAGVVVANRLDRQHRHDLIVALARGRRVMAAAHVGRRKRRRLLIWKKDKADGPRLAAAGKKTREL